MTRPPQPRFIGSRYQLHERLGAGSMGTVYRATDRLTGQLVALKRVLVGSEALMFERESGSTDPHYALATEFRVLASLRHPNIIEVIDYGFDAERQPYFAMRLLDHPQTIDAAAAGQDVLEIVDYLIQTLQALVYLHRRGIVHRDLKPGNILLDADGRVKVVDFGLAVNPEQAREAAGALAYMAPEVLQGYPATPQSDLYAIGVMAYEMLVGHHPFPTESASQFISETLQRQPDWDLLRRQITARSGDSADVEQLVQIVQRLMARQPDERYSDAHTVIRMLSLAVQRTAPLEDAEIHASYTQAARFVGRDEELSRLMTALQTAEAGEGSAWLVTGESGVGKSRLVDELRIRALVQGCLVLRGQSVMSGGQPYQVWRDPLRRLVLSADLDNLRASILRDVVTDIGALLGRQIDPPPKLEEVEYRQRLFSVIVDCIRQQQQPVLLILEDLQWASESSLQLIQRLVEVAGRTQLMLVGTFRDDEAPDLPKRLRRMNVLRLERLSPEDVRRLSESILGPAGHLSHVVDMLEHETEGNVLFLVEVVQMLAEEAGRIEDIGTATLPERILAGGIQRVVERRLERVPAYALPLLQVAAVAGRQLDLRMLAHTRVVREQQIDLEQWVSVCANSAMLVLQDDQWRFAHDKLREGVTAPLSDEQRVAIHRDIVLATEAAYTDSAALASRLVEHCRAAGLVEKEAYYTRAAGEQAFNAANFQQALALFQRSLALQPEDDYETRAWLLNMLGHANLRLIRFPEATLRYRTLQELAEQVGDEAGVTRALIGQAQVLLRQGDTTAADQMFYSALQRAPTTGDLRLLADAMEGCGVAAVAHERYQVARAYHNEARTLRRELGDRSGYADSLINLGNVAYRMNQYEHAMAYYEEAMQVKEALEDRGGLARILTNYGAVLSQSGDHERARTYQERALHIQRDIGDSYSAAHSLNNLGTYAVKHGDYTAALSYYQEAREIFRAIDSTRSEAALLNNMGNVALYLDDTGLALEYHQESYELRLRSEDRRGLALTLNNLGRVSYRMGDHRRAYDYHTQSLALREELDDRQGAAYSLCDRGFVQIELGDPAAARADLGRALRIAQEIHSEEILRDAILGFALLHLLAGEPERSAELLGYVEVQPDLHIYTLTAHVQPLHERLTAALLPAALRAALVRGGYMKQPAVLAALLDG